MSHLLAIQPDGRLGVYDGMLQAVAPGSEGDCLCCDPGGGGDDPPACCATTNLGCYWVNDPLFVSPLPAGFIEVAGSIRRTQVCTSSGVSTTQIDHSEVFTTGTDYTIQPDNANQCNTNGTRALSSVESAFLDYDVETCPPTDPDSIEFLKSVSLQVVRGAVIASPGSRHVYTFTGRVIVRALGCIVDAEWDFEKDDGTITFTSSGEFDPAFGNPQSITNPGLMLNTSNCSPVVRLTLNKTINETLVLNPTNSIDFEFESSLTVTVDLRYIEACP
jgi:hypothetical protein